MPIKIEEREVATAYDIDLAISGVIEAFNYGVPRERLSIVAARQQFLEVGEAMSKTIKRLIGPDKPTNG